MLIGVPKKVQPGEYRSGMIPAGIPRETIILSHDDVAALLPHGDVAGMVETVFREWGNGNVIMPPKINLDMSRSGSESWCNAMPAYLATSNTGGIKWVGGYGGNPARGLPYIMGIVVLTDPETGRTLSVMDGTYISDWRTGASAAVAARYLAKDKVEKIAMIGAGAQGKTAAVCIGQAFPSATMVVADIAPEKRQAFCHEMMQEFHLAVASAPSVEAAVAGADIVVLLTTAKEPIVRTEWISKGCLTLAMGSYQQAQDDLILNSDAIVVDSWGQAAHRGELKKLCESGAVTEQRIHGELGAIVAGKKAGRRSQKENIIAVLVGLGAHDVFIAGQVYAQALARGVGQKVRLNSR